MKPRDKYRVFTKNYSTKIKKGFPGSVAQGTLLDETILLKIRFLPLQGGITHLSTSLNF